MRNLTQQQLEEDRELKREEIIMRREELDYEAQLTKREEMSQRENESEAFASVFANWQQLFSRESRWALQLFSLL